MPEVVEAANRRLAHKIAVERTDAAHQQFLSQPTREVAPTASQHGRLRLPHVDGPHLGDVQLLSTPVVHSADRRYWWNGREWQLAVSPDGRLWFDGIRWIPNPLAPPPVRYMPTRWTRPLQVAVIALAVMGFATFLLMAGLAISTPPAVVVVTGSVPPEEAARMTTIIRESMITGTVDTGVGLLVLVVLIVLGALRRWRWMFWITLVGFGLVVIGPLIGLAASVLVLPRPPVGTMPPVPNVPLPFRLASLLYPAADLLLFVCMLVVAVRIGPWACQPTTVERPDLQPPTTG